MSEISNPLETFLDEMQRDNWPTIPMRKDKIMEAYEQIELLKESLMFYTCACEKPEKCDMIGQRECGLIARAGLGEDCNL
jgi:hypothetical protein